MQEPSSPAPAPDWQPPDEVVAPAASGDVREAAVGAEAADPVADPLTGPTEQAEPDGAGPSPTPPSPGLVMTKAAPGQDVPWPLEAGPAATVLQINGRRYALADLPDDVRLLFEQIRRADSLIAQKRESYQLLRWGQNAWMQELNQRLLAVEPLPDQEPNDGGIHHQS